MDKAQLIEDVKRNTREVCDRLNRAAEAAATKASSSPHAVACEKLMMMLEVLENLKGVAEYIEEDVNDLSKAS